MKLLKRITCSLLTILLINASLCMPVLAAEETNVVQLEAVVTLADAQPNLYLESRATTFIDTSIDMSFSADGMYIAIHTDMSKTASVVGVKDIEIQKKGLFGWTTVATSTGGESYNVGGCVVHLNYSGAEYGEIYRVTCVHYGNVDGYRELYHETVEVTCIY